MILELLKEIKSINNENYSEFDLEQIDILEFDLDEGTLLLNFNNKLKLKITFNSNKNFIKFEVLHQDKRFWSQNSNEIFRYTSENKIPITSSSYLDIHLIKEGYFELLGYQSLIEDGVTIYLDRDITCSYKKETLIEFFIALMEWSYNAPEFNVKEEIKEVKEKWIAEDYFRLFSSNQEINDILEITGFNYCEDFDKESSLITIKIKKGA